jgi:hypothetical protein
MGATNRVPAATIELEAPTTPDFNRLLAANRRSQKLAEGFESGS